MVANLSNPSVIDAVPRPQVVRMELIRLARRVKLTRDLLRLSEQVYEVRESTHSEMSDSVTGGGCNAC